MAFKLADWIKDTSTTTGTDDFALVGAFATFRSFDDVLSDGDTTHYTAYMDGYRESGLGTYNATTGVLARTIVFESTAGGAKVSFPAGTKTIICSPVGPRMLTLDGPERPRLRVHKNGVAQLQSAAGRYKVTFSTKETDVGNRFNTGDSRWTPEAGVHFVDTQYMSRGSGGGATARSMRLELCKNGTVIASNVAYAPTAAEAATPAVKTWIESNGTDYFEVFALNDAVNSAFNISGAPNETWFATFALP